MTRFFRFPHTPHLTWLGAKPPRHDKVLDAHEARALLSHHVVVEEKVDGANLGFSVDEHGTLRAQNRGEYLSLEEPHGQFRTLMRWVQPRQHQLVDALSPHLMLFGEWCYAVHSIRYSRLPDWFLAFDIYDRAEQRFWSVSRRDAFTESLGLAVVPRLGEGRFDLPALMALLGHSKLADGPAEGLYVRRDEGGHLAMRAKLVRQEFAQAIERHWSKRSLRTNALAAERDARRPSSSTPS
jgi:hypothetical protein